MAMCPDEKNRKKMITAGTNTLAPRKKGLEAMVVEIAPLEKDSC
jgi:hypothetical protein